MSFFLFFAMIILFQFVGNMVFSLFTDNPFLISMLTALALAFITPIFYLPKDLRKQFYKVPLYHTIAPITAILLLTFDMLMWFFVY